MLYMDKLLKDIKDIKFKGWVVYIPIALLLNTFLHKLASTLYSNCEYNINRQNSIQFLFIIGIVILIIDKLAQDGSIKIKINKDVIKGFRIGGILILASALINSWGDMGDSFQTVLIGVALVSIVYFCKN